MSFKCKRCGRCCQNIYVTYTMVTDVERWKEEGREDIISFLDHVGRMWVNPKTREPIEGDCPFLVEDSFGYFSCEIEDTKPNICRNFQPTKMQATNLGCKGYEDEL